MSKRTRKRTVAKPKATTQDIVGGLRFKPVDGIPAKWRKHYLRLLEVREGLVRRQSGLSRDAVEETPSFSSHMADAATDNYDRDLVLGMLSSEHNAVYEIDQALHRMRRGDYGVCEMTGKPIERARLEAIPWTRFSLAAERSIEAQGGRDRPRLGDRDSVSSEALLEEEEEEQEEAS